MAKVCFHEFPSLMSQRDLPEAEACGPAGGKTLQEAEARGPAGGNAAVQGADLGTRPVTLCGPVKDCFLH